MTLNFRELQSKCAERADSSAFPHGLSDWRLTQWTNALAGEVGETCNYAKKVERDGVNYDKEIGKELADVVIYAAIVAEYVGLDLGEEVRKKFNEVSAKRGVNIKI